MRKFAGFLIVLLIPTSVLLLARPLDRQQTAVKRPLPRSAEVGALGRIEPQSRVLHVNAPSTMEPPVVAQLKVEVGDAVEAGEILAILDSHRREQADVEQAKAALALSEKALERIRAGAKPGEISAQEALVQKTAEELALARKKLERVERLIRARAMTHEDLDVQRSEVEVLNREVTHQQEKLAALKEVRTVDIEHAEAEVQKMKASLQRAEADLEISLIRSPVAGEILRINSRVSERIGPDGLLDLGDTRAMEVVAEVHEADIPKVRLGQRATAMIRNLDHRLTGYVCEIGRMIGRKDVLSNDPVEDTDARVVEVRIRLDAEHSRIVSGLSNAKVEVVIHPEP